MPLRIIPLLRVALKGSVGALALLEDSRNRKVGHAPCNKL